MRAIINGVEGGKIGAYKGAALTLLIHLVGDNGEIQDLTDGAVSVLIYDTLDRRNAVISTKAGVLTDAVSGYVTATYAAGDMTFGPSTNSVPYYAFAKYTATGGAETVVQTPTQIIIK